MTKVRFEEVEGGAVARRGGEEVARVEVELRDPPRLYPQAWITATGERAHWPDLYALAADGAVRAGYVAHHVNVPANDAEQLELWFSLCFGRQHVYASLVLAPVAYEGPVRVRDGTIDDAVRFSRLIAQRLGRAPVWSSFGEPTPEEDRGEWEEFLAEAGTRYLVAELDGQAVAHLALADDGKPGATYLAVAATSPEARGRGAMRALWAEAVAWALAQGYERCDTDWRSANLEADRSWRALGFRPTRYRLHRLVGR